MLKYLCLFALVLTAAFSAAAQASPKPSETKPDYSKEAFVDEEDLAKVTFENDGTGTRESTLRLRIQSDAGVQRYSVLTFPYQDAFETVEIVYVRVRKPDGTVIVTPAENILDMPSDITRQAPFYSDLHEKHVAVKGLTAGDVLETQTRWHVIKPLAPGQFWTASNFSHDFILLHQEIQISVPRDRAVKWKSPALKPVVTEEGGRRIFTWTRSQLEHQSADQDKTEQEKQAYEAARGKLPAPDIQLSSFQSWEEIGAWYGSLQQERVKPSPEIRAKAAELTKNATDDNAKLRAIYNYVSTQFRYIGVAFGIGRYQPHSAEDVLANQYGDCKDKHTLLASLLDAAGIKAYPALINSSHELDPDVPSPLQFDHVITALPQGKDFLWLDTTAEVAPFGYLIPSLRNKSALVVPEDKPAILIRTAAELPYKAVRLFKFKGKLDSTGTLDGKVEVSSRGDIELLLRLAFRRFPQMQWKELVQNISNSNGFSGTVSEIVASRAELTDDAFHYSYTYNRKEYSDWKDHQITPPFPPFLLPLPEDADKKPSQPIWLGDAGESLLQADVELPGLYSPRVPPPVDLKRDFAEYQASYEWSDGVLHAQRRLLIKNKEIPVSQYQDYKSFCKVISDDEDHYIPLSPGTQAAQNGLMSSFRNELWGLPDSQDDEAMLDEAQAKKAMQRGDLREATADLKLAVAKDPKFTRAWEQLGTTLAALKQTDESLDALRKGAQVDPKQAFPQKMLGFALTSTQKYEDAVPAWQEYLKNKPDDVDADLALAFALRSLTRYSEAAAAYEAALKVNPDRYGLQVDLGTVTLLAGDEQRAVAVFQKLLAEHPDAEMLNDVGYELADQNKQLPLALQYAEKAVREEEEASAKVDISNLKVEDLRHTSNVGADWDTLGWVYFRMNNYEAAEKYLDAAWTLSQDGAEAAHLGQVYEKQNKKASAIHMYRLALYRMGLSSQARPATTTQMQETQSRLNRLTLGQSGKSDGMIELSDELSHMRVAELPKLVPGTESADFFVLFSANAKAPGFTIEDVKFVSGSEQLKSATSALKAARFQIFFPDAGPTKLVRRGVLNCYQHLGCSFALSNPDSTNSVN
jgi:tetratricopeptide (TPR) repeat protein